METMPLEVVSLSKREFDNQRVKPDNVLFFVYDEYVSEDKKAKIRTRLYKGRHLVLGDLYEVVSNLKGCDCSFRVGEVGFLPAGSKPEVTNTGTEQHVVLNVKIPADKILAVGEVRLCNCEDPSVTITQDPVNINRHLLNITFQRANQVSAGTARLLTADAMPTITVNNSPNSPDMPNPSTEESGASTRAIITDSNMRYVHIGIPSSPYTKTTEEDLKISYNSTGLGSSLGYAEKTDYLNDGWLNDIKIVGKRQIVKNKTKYPCFVFARTFPSNGDTQNYSSTDNILLIPPLGKGIITHDKTYPTNGVGLSQVYPTIKTKPKIVYEVLFKNTDTELYDSINSVKTQISGTNLAYNESSGLSGDNIVITLPPTEPSSEQRPGAAYPSLFVNKLDSILYPYVFFCMIHFIGSSAANVDTKMTCCGSIDVKYENLSEKILVLSPFHKYSTDRLDLMKWSELSLFSTGLEHWIYHAVSKFTFTVKNGSIKGIRIIAGTPADFLRDPEFLLYKFD